jgi:WD40 repeat protein
MKALRFFLSSPGDVGSERAIAGRVFERLRQEYAGRAALEAYFWEHEPMRATQDFQEQIPPPSSYDVVICILWSRLGTRLHARHSRPDGTPYDSGTEYEFEDAALAAMKLGKPELLVYLNRTPVSFPAEPEDELRRRLDQYQKLKAFVAKWFFAPDQTIRAAFNQYTDLAGFEEQFEAHLRSVVDRLAPATAAGAGAAAPRATWTKGSPFRGLQSFEFEHAPVFFGRTRAIGGVLEGLRRQTLAGRPFVLVAGMSGSGKSSLVKAGVLPLLTRPGVMEGIGLWRWALLRPSDQGGDLWRGLAEALLMPAALPELTAGTTAPELAQLLKGRPGEAVGLIRGALTQAAAAVAAQEKLTRVPEARLALVVDQMEELFTHPAMTKEAPKNFVRLLKQLTNGGRVWVLATLRSDFLHRCEEVPDLIELKAGEGLYQLEPPSSAEIGQLIRLPALAAGLQFEYDNASGERLDDLLRDAALRDRGALPLLEFALEELFQRSAGQPLLTLKAYHEMGGIEGALQKRAEDEFGELTLDAQQAFEAVFRELVQVSAEAEDQPVRRRAPQTRLHATPAAKELTDAFVAARLLVADNGPHGPEVAVAHEALLRAWSRLAGWITQNREFLATRARVSAAARRWVKENCVPDLLLPEGKPLAEARELLTRYRRNLSAEETGFVEGSIRRAEDRAQRRLHQLRVAAAGFALLAVLAMGGGTWALFNQREAQKQRIEAEQQRREADRQKQVVEVQKQEVERQKGEAVAQRQAAEQQKKEADTQRQEAERQKRKADAQRQEADIQRQDAEQQKEVADAQRQEAERQKKEADSQRQNAERQKHELQVAFSDADFSVALEKLDKSDDTAAIAYLCRALRTIPENHDANALLAFILSSQRWFISAPENRFPRKDTNGEFLRLSRDLREVIISSPDHTARVWDAATGRAISAPMPHGGAVLSARFSPDGNRLITTASDNTARIWETATGRPISAPMRHRDKLRYTAFSPDGSRVVTASEDNTAQVWDAYTGQPIGQPMRHGDTVYVAVFDPDGKHVVTASADSTARVWDAATGRPTSAPMRHDVGDRIVVSASFSPDGKRVVTASWDGTARIWDATTGLPVAAPMRHDDAAVAASFSPDGKRVVTASWDKTARVWDATTGQPVSAPMQHDNFVKSAVFSADGERVLTASADHTARIWNATTGRPISAPMRHDNELLSADFSADENSIVTFSGNGIARIWRDTATGQAIPMPMPHAFNEYLAWSLSRDGKRVVITSWDKTARVWDAATGQPISAPMSHDNIVFSVSFNPDASRVVTASYDHTARVWDAVTGRPISAPMRHEDEVRWAEFSPDGSRVVTASWDKTARVWDAATGQPISAPMQHDKELNWASFSPDGKRILTASNDGTARVWDAATGQPVSAPMRHKGTVVYTAFFSPDGSRVVTASDDKTARVWDAATGNPISAFMRHDGIVFFASFSPDGKRVVTASADNTARMWDATTGWQILPPMRHNGQVVKAFFSPDGKRIVTLGGHPARIWDAATGKPVSTPMDSSGTVFFSPDGSRAVTISSNHTARIWSLYDDIVPAWTLDLAETLAQCHLDSGGSLSFYAGKSVDWFREQAAQKSNKDDPMVVWARQILKLNKSDP